MFLVVLFISSKFY